MASCLPLCTGVHEKKPIDYFDGIGIRRFPDLLEPVLCLGNVARLQPPPSTGAPGFDKIGRKIQDPKARHRVSPQLRSL